MKNRTIQSKYLFKEKGNTAHPPIIIAYQIKTPENLGNIIRLADNAGCKKVIIASSAENIRKSKVRKTAGLSFDSMDWEVCKLSEIFSKIPDDYRIVSLETSSDSVDIFTAILPEKMAIIVGNEVVGIENKMLDFSSLIVHIPLAGNNTSMNVSHALAVALFEWRRQVYSL